MHVQKKIASFKGDALVLILISIAFLNVIGIKYTNPDDISIVFKLNSDPLAGAIQHAISDSRIWIVLTDLYTYFVLKSRYSDIFIYLIDVSVTFSIYVLISKILNTSIAKLWVVIFLSLVPIGWWFNILVACPGFYLDAGLISLTSLFLINYLETKKKVSVILSLILYTFSIINYEIFSILSFLCVASIIFRHTRLDFRSGIKTVRPYVIITLIYAFFYVGWKITYPFTYDGSTFSLPNYQLLLDYIQKMFGSALAITSMIHNQPLTYSSHVYEVEFIYARLNWHNLVFFYANNFKEAIIPALFLWLSLIVAKRKVDL